MYDVIEIQSRSMPDPPLYDIDSKNNMNGSEPPLKDSTISYGSTQMIYQLICTRSNLILDLTTWFYHSVVQQIITKFLPGTLFLDNIPTVRQ